MTWAILLGVLLLGGFFWTTGYIAGRWGEVSSKVRDDLDPTPCFDPTCSCCAGWRWACEKAEEERDRLRHAAESIVGWSTDHITGRAGYGHAYYLQQAQDVLRKALG